MTTRATLVAFGAALAAAGGHVGQASQSRGSKVFISVDMEGLAGVVSGSDVSSTGPDYAHFRKIMAGEANAAVEGAADAGATEFVVRDSHGAKQNLLPADLDPRAQLLRGQNSGPKNMMEGIDESFGAAIFIGYHARAGTPNAILAHTSNGNVIDFSINGVSMPEAGYNALVAGLYNVPVVFVAGDQAFVDQARTLLGPVAAFATKRAIDGAVLSLSPERARTEIRLRVASALKNRVAQKPYKLAPPYTMVLKVRTERPLYKDAKRQAPGESTFVHNDLLEILNAFNAMK
jgi:D-amino peptidase